MNIPGILVSDNNTVTIVTRLTVMMVINVAKIYTM